MRELECDVCEQQCEHPQAICLNEQFVAGGVCRYRGGYAGTLNGMRLASRDLSDD